MKYYVAKIEVRPTNNSFTVVETALTKPAERKLAQASLKRFQQLGTDGVCLTKYKSAYYKRIIKAQDSRRRSRPFTLGDVAREIEKDNQEQQEAKNEETKI